MAKVIDYQLIFYGDAMELESQVRIRLNSGWELYGSPLVFGQSVGQALIRYETCDASQAVPSTLMPPQEAPFASHF
jgi:hypothetical protein